MRRKRQRRCVAWEGGERCPWLAKATVRFPATVDSIVEGELHLCAQHAGCLDASAPGAVREDWYPKTVTFGTPPAGPGWTLLVGPEVKRLQAALSRAGFPPANSHSDRYSHLHGRSDDPLDPDYWDGHFGPGTQAALWAFLRSGETLTSTTKETDMSLTETTDLTPEECYAESAKALRDNSNVDAANHWRLLRRLRRHDAAAEAGR